MSRAYERLNAGTKDDKLPNSTLMCFPPPLPSTSIYTEGDGIIGWEHCLDIADEYTENRGKDQHVVAGIISQWQTILFPITHQSLVRMVQNSSAELG